MGGEEGKRLALFEENRTNGLWVDYEFVCASRANPLADLGASFRDHSPLIDKARAVTFIARDDEIHIEGFAPHEAGAYSLDVAISSDGAAFRKLLGVDVKVYKAQFKAHSPFSDELATYIRSVFTKHACQLKQEQTKAQG